MELKEYLTKRGISNAKFGKLIGVSGASIGLLSKQKRDTSLRTALRIQHESEGKVKVTDLIEESEWKINS